MPSKSATQHRFMAMASDPESRKKARGKMPPISVAKEFMAADKGKKFKEKKVRHRGKAFSFK